MKINRCLKKFATVLLTLAVSLTAATAWAAGKVVDGYYHSPFNNFSVTVPQWRGLTIQDRNDADFAIVTFLDRSDIPAPLRSIICLRLPADAEPMLETQEKRDVLYQRFFYGFALPAVFQSVAPRTSVAQQELIGDGEARFYFAVINIPEAHTALRNPRENKQEDSVSALLIFHNKGFMYLLRTEMKSIFNPTLKASSLTPGELESARKALMQIKDAMRFGGP